MKKKQLLGWMSLFSLMCSAQTVYAQAEVTTQATPDQASYAAAVPVGSGLVSMTDDEMGNVEGQALLNLSYLAPTEDINPALAGVQVNAGNVGFYTLSMEAEVAINSNIRKLQLGCGGVNNANAAGCDIDIDRFSLGCIANTSGVCITLPPTGIQKTGANNDNSDNGQQIMRDLVLTNPFFQFAIRNPTSAATRQVVGVRIGAANVNGPMSFGSINQFSGFLTGAANLTMRGETDVSPTCRTPDVCPNTAGRSRYTGASAYLKLDDAEILNAGIYRVNYRDVTIDYDTVIRNGLQASVNGNRQTQALIAGLQLGAVVDEVVNSVELNRRCIRNLLGACSIVGGIADALLPLLRTGIGNYIKGELAAGLGTTAANLNTYQLPYNLRNVHQLEIDSDVFGITLSAENLQYPGFVAPVQRGWGLYLPNAFTLNIDDRVSTLVANIAGSSAARDGNIVGLEAPYRNCFGTLTFC